MNLKINVLAVYLVHAITVGATVWVASLSGLVSFWVISLIALPLGLSVTGRFQSISYNLNVRILFPISVGLFFLFLYDYVPQIIDFADSEAMKRIGISNENSGLSNEFFVVNPLFKDAVSVLYAICTAFLLWKGLNDFDALKHTLYEEAGQVRLISDFCAYFTLSGAPDKNTPTVERLHLLLSCYLENILAGNKVVVRKENEVVLKDCIREVSKLETADSNDVIALEEMMKGIANLARLRSQRMVCVEKQMSPFILGLMFLMSLAMVLSFFGKVSSGPSFEYIYIFLLPAFYTSIFMTLVDLSSPFDGYWSIKVSALTETQQYISDSIKKQTF